MTNQNYRLILEEKIDNAVQDISIFFTKDELEQIKLMFKLFSGKDAQINKDVSSNKSGQKCIAYIIEDGLCKSTSNNENNALRSHVVSINQLEKLQHKESEFYKKSNLMYDVLTNRIIESTTSHPIFIGFCNKCEESFTDKSDINIDSEINIEKIHMFKYLYRYLGKEITGQTFYINFLKSINEQNKAENLKTIDRTVFNKFLLKMKNSNLESEINRHVKHRICLKILFLDLGSILKDKINNFVGPEVFEFIETTVDFNSFGLIGQSLLSYPIQFKEFESEDFIFTNFVFDNKTNKTKCYMLIKKDVYNTINHNNAFDSLSCNQKAFFIALISFLYSNELYFTDHFKNNNLNKIEELTKKVDITKNLIGQFDFLLSHIKNNII